MAPNAHRSGPAGGRRRRAQWRRGHLCRAAQPLLGRHDEDRPTWNRLDADHHDEDRPTWNRLDADHHDEDRPTWDWPDADRHDEDRPAWNRPHPRYGAARRLGAGEGLLRRRRLVDVGEAEALA